MIFKQFLYYILMTGVVWDSNPQGALRAIKEIEEMKHVIEGKTKNL